MNIQEVWNIRYGQVSIQDKELISKIVGMVKQDIVHRVNELQERIQNLIKEFIEQHYSQEELEAKIQYDITLFRDGYAPYVSVYVYPVASPDIQKYSNVINGGYTYYTHSSYVKERNILGELVKSKLTIYEEYNKLLEEKNQLINELKEMTKQVEELQERLGEQEQQQEEEDL